MKPPNPFGLSPPFALWSGVAAAGATCQGGHSGYSNVPGRTSQATTGVAFVPFSSGAASLHGARGMVLDMPWMETVKERTWLGASTASPTHFGAETHRPEWCLWLDTRVALTLGTLGCGYPPRPGPVELEGGGCFHITPGWCCPGHHRGRCSGASPMTDFCHQWDVTGSLGPTGTSCPPWGLFAMALPGLGHWLCPQAAVLLQRHVGGQRGISQGISHAGTSCFSPLPLTMSLTLKSLTLPPACPHHLLQSQDIAAALPPFCCDPFHVALAWTLVSLCPALYRNYLH